MDWESLTFGRYGLKEILPAVRYNDWQEVRLWLKGKTLEQRYARLQEWIWTARGPAELLRRQIQVTNYVNALRRGGMIAPSQKFKGGWKPEPK
jgi:hypothetical protein